MAEILSPGVYIEEVPETTTVTLGASTSNAAFVGFTDMGPSNDAVLVTTFAEYLQRFGSYRSESFMTYAVQGFFQNGGRRAYIVRVPPADAVVATGSVRAEFTEQSIEEGDGVLTTFTKTAVNTPLNVNDGDSPVVEETVSISWRGIGTPVAASPLKKRDGTTNLVGVTAQNSYEGRLASGVIPAVDHPHFAVVPGATTLNFTVGGMGQTLAIPAPSSGTITTMGSGGGVSSLRFDHATSLLSVTFTTAPDNSTAITLDFTPATATYTAVDDGAGALTSAGLSSGSITYATGAYTFTTTAPATPHDMAPIVCTYEVENFTNTAISAGTWGNNVRVTVSGNEDFYTNSTVSFSRHDIAISMLNEESGTYDTKEFYEGLVLTDSTSPLYFPDVVNDVSEVVVINEPGGNETLPQLNGTSRSVVIAGGDELAGSTSITVTLPNAPIQPRTVSIAYTSTAGNARVVTDDGVGGLTGAVDTAAAATINYTTGAITFKCQSGDTIDGGTLVVASYYSTASASSASWDLGDTDEGFTAGTDGTFDSTNYGRNQISVSSLEASESGIYALNPVEELMQVVVPDFVNTVAVTQDILTYCEGRVSQAAGPDRFAILSVPSGYDRSEAVDWIQFELQQSSKFGAVYWPWVRVADPLADGRAKTIPAVGHIAGIYARTDNTRNVGKAPGGTVDGQILGIIGLEALTTQGDRDVVYPKKINPLISATNTGNAVWGVRTLSNVSAWRTVNVPRLFMFVERSVYNSIQWAVFENNGGGLWGRISSQLNSFLGQLYREGYFAGNTPAEAFSVICDETNNTAETILRGEVVVDVAIAPNRPAEFVRMRFAQKTLS